MPKPVFLSHSTDDAPTAINIRDALEAAGIGCWMAPRDIAPGADYGAQIIDAIEACAVMVLVLSETSNNSQYVRNEVERAIAKHKRVIPVRIHNVMPSRSLEFFVSNAQWIDAWDAPLEKVIGVLATAVRKHPSPASGQPDSVPAAAATTSQPPRAKNNLPAQLTRFIGRERAIAEVTNKIDTARLVTLTGSGGAGKTRLALQVAAAVTPNFGDGVWLTQLAAVSAGSAVADVVAKTFGLPPSTEPMLTVLMDYLRARHMLLVLDNCEHLIQASAELAETLLQACPDLHVLATSREALGVAGELAWLVPSLQLPDATAELSPAELANFEAVRLFIDRAALATPSFVLTGANADAVRQICVRLDGIPLAIELAAARVKTLTPQDIAARLGDRFRLLTGGSRTVLPRHQTLRALIDWSYQLLTEDERIALRRMAIFADGWTLAAAERVCAGDDIDPQEMLDLLTRLVEKSLVVLDPRSEERRYTMLETIRQYLVERLADAGESTAVHDRHLDYFAEFGVRVGSQFDMARWAADQVDAETNQVELGAQLARDANNLFQAMDWATETGRSRDGLRMLHALKDFLVFGVGQSLELGRFRALLESPGATHDALVFAMACITLGKFCLFKREIAQADAWLERAEASIGQLDAPQARMKLLLRRADLAEACDDYARARVLLDQRRAIANLYAGSSSPGPEIDELAEWLYGRSLLAAGDYVQALGLLRPIHARQTKLRNDNLVCVVARALGYAALHTGGLSDAAVWLRESLLGNLALTDRTAVAASLAAWAAFNLMRGELPRSARLFGAYEAYQEAIHGRLQSWDAKQVERHIALLRQKLPASELDEHWAAGRAMSLEQAIDFALASYPL